MAAAHAEPLLRVDALAVRYGKVTAVESVDLSVPSGGFVGLLGANGAGKTSTVRAVSGLVRSTGAITFAGEDISAVRPHHRVARGLVQVPQGRELFNEMTVEENLKLGGRTVADVGRRQQQLDRVYHYFPVLADRRSQRAGTLSGGEQQMLAIGRGLAAGPTLLILDEPTLGLAPVIIQHVQQVLEALHRDEGVAILLVDQNVSTVLSCAEHLHVMTTGRIVYSGTPRDPDLRTELTKNYLGA